MGKSFCHVDTTERRLVKNMAKEGVPWSTIQKITGRTPDTINSIIKARGNPTTKGAPVKFKPKDVDKVLKVLEGMVKEANAQKEVTLDMVLKKAGYEVSTKTARKGIKQRKVAFYKLKEKPLLEPSDVKDRKKFADDHKHRSAARWVVQPHAIIDDKSFQMTCHEQSREYAARRSVRGAYQKKGSMPKHWLVKPSSGANKAKFPGIRVTAAVIKGKIRVWKYTDGKWNAKAAAEMYKHALAPALKKAYPDHKGPFTIIEDNDPTGYKSKLGIAAKKDARIIVDCLPKRSPDLNVLDYSLWHEINVRLRKQERSFRKEKRETKEEFKGRLRKTAMGLPASFVKAAVGSMKRRCAKIADMNGDLFTE